MCLALTRPHRDANIYCLASNLRCISDCKRIATFALVLAITHDRPCKILVSCPEMLRSSAIMLFCTVIFTVQADKRLCPSRTFEPADKLTSSLQGGCVLGLTKLTLWAEHYSRGHQLCYSIVFQHFMQPEGSSPILSQTNPVHITPFPPLQDLLSVK
jgi:hypothetical protein